MLLFIDRCINHFLRWYRKKVFVLKVGLKTSDVRLSGKVNLLSGKKSKIFLGGGDSFYDGVTLWGGPITLGDNVSIGQNTVIAAIGEDGVTIGDNTIIAAQCYIIDCDHSFEPDDLIRNQKQKTAPISIGKDVWIAANVTILKGVTIGDGAVIGAKSLVNKDIPANAVAVGIPAKVIKYRTAENMISN